MNEKELRIKIRSELEKKHQTNKKSSKNPETEVRSDLSSDTNAEEKYLHDAILQSIEHEICSKLPEMVECENHLGEIKWLTPLELHHEFEFYPVEESRWQKIKSKFFGYPKLKIPQTEYWQKFAEEQQKIITDRVNERLDEFRKKQTDIQKEKHKDQEARIYEEELDRFYSSKKGYKKYKNHLGESKWMTKAEAEQQDEFYEEDPLVTPEWIKRIAFLVFLMLVIAGWWLWRQSKIQVLPKAYLVVELNDNRGNLYIDRSLAAGFKANEPYPITAGKHEISLIRDGYISVPKSHQIDAAESDTVRIQFDFEKKETKNIGYLLIKTNGTDGDVYLNDDFYGNLSGQSFFIIDVGEHSIRVDKKGYYAFPYAQNVDIRFGDTTEVYFELRRRNDPVLNETASGLIEIRSNIKNAEIFLNGKKTEYKTDYIMQRLPFGQYAISLVKEGYKVYPDEQVVRINQNEARGLADFTLSSTTNSAEIETVPVNGEIFINGKSVGTGNFRGSLPLGEHTISFGDVAYYTKPAANKIYIEANKENKFSYTYKVNYSVELSPKETGPVQFEGSYSLGYFFQHSDFIPDPENGPQIRKVEAVNGDVWFLSYGFQYRNPPGNDGVKFEFNIPEHIDLYQGIDLKVWGYRTSINYPLAVRGNTVYQIFVNGNTFQPKVTPRYTIKDIGENNFDSFVVNEYLRKGKNTILISTTGETSAEFALWKIRIE